MDQMMQVLNTRFCFLEISETNSIWKCNEENLIFPVERERELIRTWTCVSVPADVLLKSTKNKSLTEILTYWYWWDLSSELGLIPEIPFQFYVCNLERVRARRRNVSVWIRCKCSIDSLIKTPQLLVSSWWRYQSLDISQLFRHSPCQPDQTTPTSSTMAMSGVKLTEACKTLYDDIQKGKKYRWVCPGVHEYMSTVYSSHIQSGTESSTYPGEWSTWRRSGLSTKTTMTS